MISQNKQFSNNKNEFMFEIWLIKACQNSKPMEKN